MKKHLLFIFAFIAVACSNNMSQLETELQSEVNNQNQTRANVNLHNQSISNPNLLDNWENVQTINLNTNGDHNVTAPWVTGTASVLSESFRKDIKKEDGWVMLFHTFKQKGLDEKQNYMFFYNQFTGFVKIFYYYEGDRASQGTQWFLKTADGSCTKLLNLTDFLAAPDDKSEISMAVFSNQIGDPTNGLETGWNGFEFEVPYCTDYKDKEFVIGAYDKVVTTYDFLGKVNLSSTGTITPMGGGTGWQSTVASLAGQGSKYLVDNYLLKAKNAGADKKIDSTANFGKKLASLISQIPAGNYTQAISAGLGLIFGKSTTVNNYDVKLTTTGKIEFGGSGSSEMTSGIPSITFDLYSFMNSDKEISNNNSFIYNPADGKDHYLGVWNLENSPKIGYKRIVPIPRPTDYQTRPDGSIIAYDIPVDAPKYWNSYTISVNPDVLKYGACSYNTFDSKVMRCDSLNGKQYKPKMIDIGDYLNSSLLCKDKNKCFYFTDGKTYTALSLTQKERFVKRNFYYDWGNIDCGRELVVVPCNINISYNGKQINVQQTRMFPAEYRVDLGVIDDLPYYNEGDRKIVNSDQPYYEHQKWINHIPIIEYEY